MTAEEIDDLERLYAAATPGPWAFTLDSDSKAASRGWREVHAGRNRIVAADWYERRSGGETETVSGVRLGEPNAAAIVALHNAAPALIEAARDLAWHEEQNGTREEQEADDAALAADLARIDALSDEECKAELEAEGIDYDASAKKFDAMLKVCAERADLKREVERLRAFVPKWKHTGGMWALFAGCANIGEIDSLGIGWAREGIGYVICYRPMGASPDLPTAARAVCARLGIPYVPVEVDDG